MRAVDRAAQTPYIEFIFYDALASAPLSGLADTGVFPTDARKIFENIGSADKEFHLITGAHYFEDNREERQAMAALLCDWVAKKR